MNQDEIIIPLPNGGSLRCGPGEECQFGGSLHICDEHGNEILMWESTEWGDDPEFVIGAVFSAASKSIEELTANRRLEDGCWVKLPKKS